MSQRQASSRLRVRVTQATKAHLVQNGKGDHGQRGVDDIVDSNEGGII